MHASRFELSIINYSDNLSESPLITTNLRFLGDDYHVVQRVVDKICEARALGLVSKSKMAMVDVDLMAYVEDYNYRHPESVMALKVKWSAYRSYKNVCSFPLYTRSTLGGLYDGSLRLSTQSEWDSWINFRSSHSKKVYEEYYALWGHEVHTEATNTPVDLLTDVENSGHMLTFYRQDDSPVVVTGLESNGEDVLGQMDILLKSKPSTFLQ